STYSRHCAGQGAVMDEYVRLQWNNEERFLEEHFETVDVLLAKIGDRWRPCYGCNDQVRLWREMMRARGRLNGLAFDSAGRCFAREGLSSIRIYLRSSERFFVARIHWPGAEAAVEILHDRELTPGCKAWERRGR